MGERDTENPENLTKPIDALAERFGLSEDTVRDLIESGWTFTDNYNDIPRFTIESPSYRLEVETLDQEPLFERNVFYNEPDPDEANS